MCGWGLVRGLRLFYSGLKEQLPPAEVRSNMATPLSVLRHATTEALKLARSGMSPQEAAEYVVRHFELDRHDAVEVESRVRHATEPHRVRAHSGVAIGLVKPGVHGMFLAIHDAHGPGCWYMSPDEAHLAVLRCDNEAGWDNSKGRLATRRGQVVK